MIGDRGHGALGLLEREAETEALRDVVAAAADGRGAVCVVDGAAGIGKSALLDRAAALAAQRDVRVLRARGRELEHDFALGVALQLLEPLVAGASGDERRRLLAGPAARADAVLAGSAPAEPTPDERGFWLLHALYWLTVHAAEAQPTLVLVDDLQWADRLSLRFLVYLAERVDGLPVGLVLGARPAEDDLLGQLRDRLAAPLLRPAPLSSEAVATLVGPAAAPAFVAACWDATRGNPLLVREVVHAARAAGLAGRSEDAEAAARLAADAVGSSVRLRLAELGEDAAAVARALAVLAAPSRPDVLAALADIGPQRLPTALDALTAAGLIEGGEQVAFVHPLIRLALYEAMPPAARADAHRRAAAALTDRGAPVEVVAGHLLHAPPAGSAEAAGALAHAARRALDRGAPEAAVPLLRRAVAEPPRPELRAALLVELAHTESELVDPAAAEHFDAALAAADGPRARATVLQVRGAALVLQGDHPGAAAAFAAGLAEGFTGDDDLRVLLEAGYIGSALFCPGLHDEALTRLEPILRSGAQDLPLPQRRLLAVVAAARAVVGGPGAREEALALADRALEGGVLLAEDGADGVALSAAHLAIAMAGDVRRALAELDAAIDDARRRGSLTGFATASHYRGQLHRRMGALPDAIADAEAARRALESGWSFPPPAVNAALAMALIETGELEAAERMLATAPPQEDPTRSAPAEPFWLWARAELHLQRGRHADALEDFRACGHVQERLSWRSPTITPWRDGVAIALAHLGDDAAAQEAAGEAVRVASEFGAPRALGMALRAAALARWRADPVPLLREAVDVLAQTPSRLEHARALVDLGSALNRAGDRGAARSELRRGLDLARRSGATALERRAEAQLRAAGARPRRAALHGPESLTGAERRVADMAAGGMTNREIAQALFVTPKTVEKHLAATYAKLGIASRSALAEALGAHA